MDDVSIYNHGLELNEIRSTFAQAKPPKGGTGLAAVAAWPFWHRVVRGLFCDLEI